MSGIKRPATTEAFKELVQQAIYEVEDLRMSIEYDMEFMEDALGLVEPLDKILREVLSALDGADYPFGGPPLAYMSFIDRQPNTILPFKTLLKQVNDTHINGLG